MYIRWMAVDWWPHSNLSKKSTSFFIFFSLFIIIHSPLSFFSLSINIYYVIYIVENFDALITIHQLSVSISNYINKFGSISYSFLNWQSWISQSNFHYDPTIILLGMRHRWDHVNITVANGCPANKKIKSLN